MLKNIFKIIAIFILGMVGGIFADQIFWPYFIERPLFYQYRLEQPPVYVTERNEITVQENVALQNAVEKIEKVVVGLETKTKAGKTIEGSGLVITSDGLMVTLAELVPQGANLLFFIDGKTPGYQILKRDSEKNLALIKLEEKNLLTIGFADFEKIKLGQRVFLVGAIIKNGSLQKTVNEGIIKTFNEDSIQTNILDKDVVKGSPLFDIEGKLVGLNLVDSTGKISAISVKIIEEFAGF